MDELEDDELEDGWGIEGGGARTGDLGCEVGGWRIGGGVLVGESDAAPYESWLEGMGGGGKMEEVVEGTLDERA